MCTFVLNSSYELDNGQIFSEAGELRTIGEQQAVVKSGAYSFVGADGITYVRKFALLNLNKLLFTNRNFL